MKRIDSILVGVLVGFVVACICSPFFGTADASGPVVRDASGAEGTINDAPLIILGSGDNTIVPAQGTGFFVRIYDVLMVNETAVDVIFKCGATEKTTPMPLAGFSGLPVFPTHRAIDCGANEAFIINTSGASDIGGWLTWAAMKVPS